MSYIITQTLKPRPTPTFVLQASSAVHCSALKSPSKHLGAEHANTPTLGQAIDPAILSSPASSQHIVQSSPLA